jgi:hypothetical protein
MYCRSFDNVLKQGFFSSYDCPSPISKGRKGCAVAGASSNLLGYVPLAPLCLFTTLIVAIILVTCSKSVAIEQTAWFAQLSKSRAGGIWNVLEDLTLPV